MYFILQLINSVQGNVNKIAGENMKKIIFKKYSWPQKGFKNGPKIK